MQSFKSFHIHTPSFDSHSGEAIFEYSFDKETYFNERINFFDPKFPIPQNIDSKIINNLLNHCAIALGISYYKLAPTQYIYTEHCQLDNRQQDFRNHFYIHGLGEFFFTNQISPTSRCIFENASKQTHNKKYKNTSDQILVPIGGGKDSCVSVELLKQTSHTLTTITFGKDYPLHHNVSQKIELPRLIIQRHIDPKLFQMNKQGYYNGHVPITGMIAFVLEIVAYLYDFRYIVMSNEKSANEENTIMDGIKINHQRSKSADFETQFQQYVSKYLSDTNHYFSLLRGMYECKIGELFAKHKHYFDSFSSCNNNFKLIQENSRSSERRCGTCPKCAFVYSILRPYISEQETNTIFAQELYDNESLLPLYKSLLGIEDIKPFECVGTNEEVTLAMYLYYQQIKNQGTEIPVILNMFEQKVLPTLDTNSVETLKTKLLTISSEPTIPKEFDSLFPGESTPFV